MLGQIAAEAKSNEITAVPRLLTMLSLEGCIVTVDALNCQREIAQQVIDQKADYVMALKGNQGTLHDDVRTFLDDPQTELSVSASTVDGDHGRIETRTAMISGEISWLQQDHKWPGLAAVGKVVRVRETTEKNNHGDRLLPAEHADDPRAIRPGRAFALGHREPLTLVPRRHHE